MKGECGWKRALFCGTKGSCSVKFPVANSVNGEISQCAQCAHGFASLLLNTGVAPRKINPCTQEKEACKQPVVMTGSIWVFTTFFTICIMFLTEESDSVGQVELPGRIMLLQGTSWASAIFQKLAGRGRSGKDMPGARSFERW